MPEKCVEAVLSLGSNIGSSAHEKSLHINTALDLLQQHSVTILKRSSHYRTAPWGNTDQDWFINACALMKTDLSANALLDACLSVEKQMGRQREQKWAPRIIDIDIITYGDEAHHTPHLTTPHPYALERAFVLVPLYEICSDYYISGIAIKEALAHLDVNDIEKV